MDQGNVFKNIVEDDKGIRHLLNGNAVTDVSADYIIPESISDTDEILLTERSITINNTEADNGSVSISGIITYDVLLLGDDGSLSGVSYSDEFNAHYYDDEITDICITLVGQAQAIGESKLINPRKINLRSDITIPLRILCKRSAAVTLEGTECIEDEMGLQRMHSKIDTVDQQCICEKDIPVSHDLELDGNNPPISKILYRHIRLTPYELKPHGNTLEIRIIASVCFIYMTEEGNRFSVEKSFTIDRSINADNAEEFDWNAVVSCNELIAEPAQNNYGEMKLIELDFDYSLTVCGIKNKTIDAYKDFYSTDYECSCINTTAHTTRLKRSYGSSLSVNASVKREDVGASDIRCVIASTVSLSNVSTRFAAERRKLIFEADAAITTVCENTSLTDEDKKYSSYSFNYPVKCELDAQDESEGSEYICDVGSTNIRYRADGSKLYCDFEVSIKIGAYEHTEAAFVSAVSFDKNSPIQRSGAPITLCYPDGSESIWDIAKYYKITEEAIVAANSLETSDISDKKVLLIPSYTPKKQIFTKVI